MRTTVTWERWRQTFFHPCYAGGSYFAYSETFDNADVARGFADGLKQDCHNRNVRVDVKR